MKQTKEFYRITCDSDGCTAAVGSQLWGESEWLDAESLKEIFGEEEWETVGEQHFCCDHRPNDEIPFVAVAADETPPWGDDRTCPRCGAQDLPLKQGVTIDKTNPDTPDIVLRYITHCGGTWLRGPIGR